MSRFIAVDPKDCTGCKTCEMVCSLKHWGESNAWKSAIRVIRKEKDGLVYSLPIVCQQCAQPACLDACASGAISRVGEDGPVIFDREACNDCGLCVGACPAGCVPVDPEGHVIMYCDLCGGEPLCVASCHAKCLTLADRKTAAPEQDVDHLAGIIEREGLAAYVPGRRA